MSIISSFTKMQTYLQPSELFSTCSFYIIIVTCASESFQVDGVMSSICVISVVGPIPGDEHEVICLFLN